MNVYVYPFSALDLQNRMFLRGASEEDYSVRDKVQLQVFKYLDDVAAQYGIQLATFDYFDSTKPQRSFHVFFRFWDYSHLLGRPDVTLTAYHTWEPPVLARRYPSDQFNHFKEITRNFRRVYSLATVPALQTAVPTLDEGLPVRKGFLAQPYDGVIEEFWQSPHRDKFCVLISNFQLHSSHPTDLYAERVRAVVELGNTGDLDVYGAGWEKALMPAGVLPNVRWRSRRLIASAREGTFSSWLTVLRGQSAIRRAWRARPATDKLSVLSRYRFCLCFESSIFEGFVTEKIFDCLAAGTIPIYLGAPDITRYVPADCFVDARHFMNYRDLFRYVETMSAAERERYRRSAHDYFQSAMYEPFRKEAFAMTFVRDVLEDARSC